MLIVFTLVLQYKNIMSYIYYMEILNILYCPIFLKKCMSYIYYMKSVIYYLFPISKKNLSGHVVDRYANDDDVTAPSS
jgi:hypothetical protein